MQICPGGKTSSLMTAAGMKRRGRKTSRVLRGGSFNNNDRGNLLSSNRDHHTPTNRNNNNGLPPLRCGSAEWLRLHDAAHAAGQAMMPLTRQGRPLCGRPRWLPQDWPRQRPGGWWQHAATPVPRSQANPRPRVLEKMKPPEHNAGIHQEKDATAPLRCSRLSVFSRNLPDTLKREQRTQPTR